MDSYTSSNVSQHFHLVPISQQDSPIESRRDSDNDTKHSLVSKLELDNVSVNSIMQSEQLVMETVNKVLKCASQAQSKICTIHGPSSEHENKEVFPHIAKNALGRHVHIHTRKEGLRANCCVGNIGNDFFISRKEILHIKPAEEGLSLILSGLHDNIVIIHGKVNHVLIRHCNNIRVDIKQGTITGVDIIHCKRMNVIMPYHNFTNVEFGQGISFHAELNDISQLHFTGSLDVKVNGAIIPIHPFLNAMFGKDGWCYKKRSDIPKLMICTY